MNGFSWAVAAAIAAALALAVRSLLRQRKKGVCAGCSGCPSAGSCASCKVPRKDLCESSKLSSGKH